MMVVVYLPKKMEDANPGKSGLSEEKLAAELWCTQSIERMLLNVQLTHPRGNGDI